MQKRDVGVTQDDQIEIAVGDQLFDGPFVQHLRASLLHPGGVPNQSCSPRDAAGYGRAHVRMEPTEEPSCASAPHHGLEDSVREVTSAQTIPMSDEGFQPRQLAHDRTLLEGEADVVREEFSAPPIMVSPHEGHGKTPVD
ncbi:uncharacterized protein METZ01_LOCUS27710 [marine metagenome]|uniref:Uncharacterized protein n=1 Tax=marine metagenome TaxID=408172 RepID=A0A381Q678_9ZZZZ